MDFNIGRLYFPLKKTILFTTKNRKKKSIYELIYYYEGYLKLILYHKKKIEMDKHTSYGLDLPIPTK